MTNNMERTITYLAGAVLLIAAIVFATLRTEGFGLVMAQEGAMQSTAVGQTLEERFDWFAEANATWEDRCSGCHETLDYIPALFAAEGGREYLVDLMLFGAQGEARIYGETQSLRHRPFAGNYSDEQIAGLLNLTLVAWGNEEALPDGAVLYEPEEIAAARPKEIPQDEVLLTRPDYPQ